MDLLAPENYKVSTSGCWLWYEPLNKGYATWGGIKVIRTITNAKRGEVVHHVCGVKRCVNPDHLKVMTKAEHTAEHNRGTGRFMKS